jgi:hypothetical protein
VGNKPRNIREFEDYVLNQIVIDPENDDRDALRIRIDILDRILELVRFHNAFGANEMSLLDVLEAGFRMDGKLIRYGIEGQERSRGTPYPKTPTDLQVHLLVFLLCRHVPREKIFLTLERFIRQIHPILTPLDFERTKTGTTRCYTNTRFALVELRRVGLLKVTQEELFKTWDLSSLGVVVAVSAYQDCVGGKGKTFHGYLGAAENRLHGGLDRFVCHDSFVSRAEGVLTRILSAPAGAGADIQLSALRKLIEEYQATFGATKLKAGERARILSSVSTEIEKLPGMKERLDQLATPTGGVSDFQFDAFINGFGQSQN